MNDRPMKILVVHTGVTTSRITSRLVQQIEAIKTALPVLVDFEQFENQIKGINPEMFIIDEVDFYSLDHIANVIKETKKTLEPIPKPRNKPLPYYHGKRRF